MVRSYKTVRPKKHRVYDGADVQRLYCVSANTVSNWVSSGLLPSDPARPYRFRGAELARFHHDRRSRNYSALRPGEAKCMACKCAVLPEPETVKIDRSVKGAPQAWARCPDCGASVLKRCSERDLAVFEGKADPNISWDSSDEENRPLPANVGIKREMESTGLGTVNDRIIYDWIVYAGRMDEKTIDQHLLAIRILEDHLAQKPFNKLSKADIGSVRDMLKSQANGQCDTALSKSTIQHRASYMRAFLSWLLKQDGFKRLSSDLPDYLDLPKSFFEKALPKGLKAYPTIDEAAEMVGYMPVHTLLDRRDRAIVAVAFLGALRADTLISLQLQHIDLAGRMICQDASVSRTKNGKSLEIAWFPLPPVFADVVVEWCVELEDMGFQPADTLFPAVRWLDGTEKPGLKLCKPMRSQHAVTKAFASASVYGVEAYTPHAAKHTIAALRDSLQLTQPERKAWSANMGHDSEVTTDQHYGKMADQERLTRMKSLGKRRSIPGANLGDDEKIAIVDAVLETIMGGD